MCVCLCVSVCVCVCMRVRVNNIYRQIYTYVCVCVCGMCVRASLFHRTLPPPPTRAVRGKQPSVLPSTHADFNARRLPRTPGYDLIIRGPAGAHTDPSAGPHMAANVGGHQRASVSDGLPAESAYAPRPVEPSRPAGLLPPPLPSP